MQSVSQVRSAGRALLRIIVACFALMAYSALPAFAQSVDRTFGVVEIGGRGVKASVFEIISVKEGVDQDVDLRVVHEYEARNISPALETQIDLVASTTAELVDLMASEKRVASRERIYVVASSGVAGVPHWPQLQTKINTAIAGKSGGLNAVSVREESVYGFNGVINCVRLAHRRQQVAFIDIGSSNIKGAFATGPAACGREPMDVFEVPLGTVRLADTAIKDAPQANAASAIAQARQNKLDPALQQAVSAHSGLASKPRVYLAGGAAWALATVTRPADRGRYVPLKASDITAFRAQLRDDATCITDMTRATEADPQACRFLDVNLSLIPAGNLREEAEKDYRDLVSKVFNTEQLLAASEILDSFSKTTAYDQRLLFFARPSRRAWMLGFLIAKEAGFVASDLVPK